jgi:polyvinyl alcohol dehydrogenase (cytochrome)|tara:strand:+ start:3312 stop:5072 length:1761 start_codon:yes stop_codon:yes gene_type:complete
LIANSGSAANNSNGEDLFKKNCIDCHTNPELKAPGLDAIGMMSRESITQSLLSGVMKAQSSGLSEIEINAIAEYLKPSDPTLQVDGYCSGRPSLTSGTSWMGWGNSLDQNRFQEESISMINLENISKLKMKWVFGVPETGRVRSQPSIAGGFLFFGSQNGTVYALDADTGCIWWTYKAKAEVRNAIAIDLDEFNRPKDIFFGDFEGRVYRLEAASGKEQWIKEANDHPLTTITGSISIYGDDIFIPLSSVEIVTAIENDYECCTFRGGLVAMNKKTGEIRWKYHTVDEPKETGFNIAKAKKWGPSGVPVWSTPTIDIKRNRVYIGTGQNYSPPSTNLSDSIVAIDIKTGNKVWAVQSDTNDIWNGSCVRDRVNCDFDIGSNFDFGASPLLISSDDQDDLIIAGQKSGMLYAIDPDNGKVVWKKRIGKGGEHGGIHWSMSSDGRTIFVPVGDIGKHPKAIGDSRSGLHAYDPFSSELIWSYDAISNCVEESFKCYSGFSAAISSTDEILFAGNLNGVFYAISSKTGEPVWEFDTRKDFQTVNSIPANGGTIDAAGPVISREMIYINSGYGGYGKLPGNALIAFEIIH